MATTILSTRRANPTSFSALTINYSTLIGSTIIISSLGTLCCINTSTVIDSTLVARNVSFSTMIGSSITTNALTINSNQVALGLSTNLTYPNGAYGAISTTTNWISSLSTLLSTKTVSMSANGQYQLAVTQISTVSSLYLTSTTNTGWFSTLSGATGLPSNTQTVYTAGALSATGQYGILGTNGGYPYITSSFGQSWYNANTTATPTNLYAHYTFNNSLADIQGRAPLTVTGSITYETGIVGLNAVRISNPGSPSVASNYIRGTMPNVTNFTISGWFKLSSYNTVTPQMIFSCGGTGYDIFIENGTNYFAANHQPLNARLGTTTFAIALNTWYSFSYTFMSGGTSSILLNGTLVGSATSPSTSLSAISAFSFGSHDGNNQYPLDGSIDDIRIFTNFIPNVESVPLSYFPFDGSTTDVQGNATFTTFGSVSYITPGLVGTSALSISNTAGANPTNYLQAPFRIGNSFTVSFNFNLLTLPPTNTIQSTLFNLTAGTNTGFQVIYIGGGAGLYVQYFSTGGWASITSAYTSISTNTWYNIRCVFAGNQAGTGTAIVYINNVQITNRSDVSIINYSAITTLLIGKNLDFASTGFNGYIDELRIYDNASAILPPLYLPFETAPTTGIFDTTGQTRLTVVGSPGVVPGIVGANAIRFTNTIGASPAQYILGSIFLMSNFTVSLWFNLQTPADGANYQIIFSMFTRGVQIFINNTATQLYALMPSGASPNNIFFGPVPISINTWYNVVLIYQSGGLCSFYVNNTLVGSGTSVTPTGLSSSNFGLGYYDAAGSNFPFNGYIDDVRIYNYAITPNPMTSMNYNNVAMSASGQYMLATANGAGLYMSSNFGTSWSQVSSALVNALWQSIAISASGQYMLATGSMFTMQTSPQQLGRGGNASAIPTLEQWYQNGILWGSISSSVVGTTFQSWIAFNTVAPTSGTGGSYSYASASNYSSGAYTGLENMTITGTTTSPSPYTGEWIEIQSSAPVICHSYNFACGANTNIPKSYYIVGSNDRSIWYPIHFAVGGATNPFSASFTRATSPNIIVNQSGPQTMTAGATGTYTCTTYPQYTTRAYFYFRLIANTLYSGNNLEFTELYMQFTSGIFPQLTGLTGNISSTTPVSTTWTQNGITWTSNSSSVVTATYQSWLAFNNRLENNSSSYYSWASAGTYNISTGNYTGSVTTTVLGGVGSVLGEWIQLQSSVPLILHSYNFADGGYANIPQKYYIVGSNDGTNWFPIQYVQLSNNIYTSFYTPFMPNIIVDQSGSQTITGQLTATASCVRYPTTTNSYTYFRLIGTQTYGVFGNLEFVELNFSFITGQLYSTNYGTTWINNAMPAITGIIIQAISENGQYAISSDGQTAYIVSNYLAGFSTNTYTTPTLPSINANIVAAALSNTGQYMVLVTAGTTNNVYYSSNFGATFINLTIGITPMTACTMSYDGAFITVTNTTTLYTLNNNGTGFSIAIGWQAGLQSQGQNAIAIGNQAATTNQIGGSIVINASGSALNTAQQGFYVNPVLPIISSSASFVSVLGYGLDNQITQSNGTVIMLPNGNLGIGTTNPTSAVQIVGQIASAGKTFDMHHPLYPNTNRRLVHSSIEGPRCDLIYRGTIVLQAGTAQLDINKQCTSSPQGAMDDGTFEALCENPQYFLQNLTGFDRLLGSIQGSTLTITCENNESTDTVSWIVVAERADPYIKEWDRTDENGLLMTQYTEL